MILSFHVVETCVVGVENVTSRGQIEHVVGSCAPRDVEHRVEPCADP